MSYYKYVTNYKAYGHQINNIFFFFYRLGWFPIQKTLLNIVAFLIVL